MWTHLSVGGKEPRKTVWRAMVEGFHSGVSKAPAARLGACGCQSASRRLSNGHHVHCEILQLVEQEWPRLGGKGKWLAWATKQRAVLSCQPAFNSLPGPQEAMIAFAFPLSKPWLSLKAKESWILQCLCLNHPQWSQLSFIFTTFIIKQHTQQEATKCQICRY